MDSNLHSAAELIIPPELTGPLPRTTRMSGNSSQQALMAAVFLAIAAALMLWLSIDSIHQARNRAALRQQSSETSAEVRRTMRSVVHYTFTVNGTSFTGKAAIPRHMRIRDSDPLLIRYLPSNPSVNHPAAWEWSESDGWARIVSPFIFVGSGLLLLFLLRAERRLVAEGVAVVAVITECSRNRGRSGGFIAKYEFRTADGSPATGSGWYADPKEIGARICVLYMPRNPKQNGPYASRGYRVAQ